MKNLRKQLHNIPEPSMQEKKTKKTLIEFLQKETDLKIVDCGSWFYAWKKGVNKTAQGAIAFRADMDAVSLDGKTVGHFCGHDGHSTILAMTGKKLTGKTTNRDVYLIFQPGEETGEGGAICSTLIKEKGITEVYGLHKHPWICPRCDSASEEYICLCVYRTSDSYDRKPNSCSLSGKWKESI